MQIGPVFLHAEQGIAAAGKFHRVVVHQGVQEGFQCANVRAADEHSGIGNQSTANHHRIQTGVFLLQDADIGKSTNISVEAQWDRAVLHGIGEPFPVHLTLIELLPHSWVNGQFFDGIAVV